MDARTGLGRFRDFRISNYALMMDLITYRRDHGIEDILALPDVRERVELYLEHAEKAKEQIQRCTTVRGNLVILDLRREETIWATNRFMIYALFPSATSPSTSCGACSNRTRSLPPASPFSTVPAAPMWVN